MTTPTLSTISLADVPRRANPRASDLPAYERRVDDHRADDALRVVWAPVVAGLWSASSAVGHVGLVEQRGKVFTAIDGRGHALGTYAARHDAEAVVESAARSV